MKFSARQLGVVSALLGVLMVAGCGQQQVKDANGESFPPPQAPPAGAQAAARAAQAAQAARANTTPAQPPAQPAQKPKTGQ